MIPLDRLELARGLSSTRLFWVALAGSLSLGCVDAQGSFDDFVARKSGAPGPDASSSADSGSDAAACTPPAPGEVQGAVFLAVALDLAPKLPFSYAGTLETPALQSGRTGLVLNLTPLAYWDRKTPVQSQPDHDGPFEIDAAGQFVAAFSKRTIPGNANPITKGDAIAQVTLTGSSCGDAGFYCGTVVAQVETLGLGTRLGTFTLTLLPAADAVPPDPLYYDCNRAVADPPPPR